MPQFLNQSENFPRIRILSLCVFLVHFTAISRVLGLGLLPSEPDSAMRTSAGQISSSYPTATFCVCRFQGIEPATFRFVLDSITSEPHAHDDFTADIVRVWLSGYILPTMCVCVCVCVYIYIYIYIYAYTCVCVCVCMYVYMYMCVCLYVCVCVFIYIYIHVAYVNMW